MSKNIGFSYLYRDASNYKQWGKVIFTNNQGVPLDLLEEDLRASLEKREFFLAGKVDVPEVFFDSKREDDHPWHEFAGLVETDLKPTDKRDILEFIADLESHTESPNSNILEGFKCPECGNTGLFHITGTQMFSVTDDGAEGFGDIEWGEESSCSCSNCYFSGQVRHFTEVQHSTEKDAEENWTKVSDNCVRHVS